MKALLIAMGLAAATATPTAAQAPEDYNAGAPLRPSDAAGPWTLQTEGHWVCVLGFGRSRSGPGYALRVPPDCEGVLPDGVLAWTPTDDGMSLIGPGLEIPFDRWSDSLLVSKRGSGVDVSLSRGAPDDAPNG